MSGETSDLKALYVLTRFALKRKLNRMFTAFGKKWKKKGKKTRAAVPRKKAGSKVLLFIFTIIFLFNSGFIAYSFFNQLDHKLASPENMGQAHESVAPEKLKVLSFLLCALSLALLFASLGSANQDLGQVEWGLQWLFTFPVKSWVLFLSKVAENIVGNLFGWFVFTPFFYVAFWLSDTGVFPSLVLAVFFSLTINGILASILLVSETWLRKNLGRGKLKNVQAVFTILGILFMMGSFYLVMSPVGVSMLIKLSHKVGSLPAYTPFGVGAFGITEIIPLHLVMAGAGIFSLAFVLLCVGLAQRFVRFGLVTETGPYQGTRKKIAAPRSSWFKGIVAKELRLLSRDRNFFVQSLFVPLVIVGFQVLINPSLIRSIGENFNHACMVSFVAGAYVLMFSAFYVITMEGKALWLLFTFPTSIAKIMFQKAKMWSIFASLIPMGLLTWGCTQLDAFTPEILINIFMVVYGVFIYAFVASGLGFLASDPFEENVKRRIKPAMIYLYMFLCSFYSYAIYAPDFSHKVTMVVICSLLAYSIWQRVIEQAPFLLEPTQGPKPGVYLSDGVGAALAFFTIQGGLKLAFDQMERIPKGHGLFCAFSIAGCLVFLTSRVILWQRGIPHLKEVLGLKSKTWSQFFSAACEGAFWGALAYGGAFAYLHLVLDVTPPKIQNWYVVLAVFMAPLFEEYIFRGLIYKGFRRTWSVSRSILVTATVFAIVHPVESMPPVFVLGLVTAYCFEKKKVLIAPIMAHAVYNAGVTLF